MKKFALIGAAGYVAPKHMRAIKDTGNDLVAAVDPNDSVGIIDSYFPEASFFKEFERFDRFIEKEKQISKYSIDYISICSPNYLHDAHIRFALRSGANAICEKPVVLNPWNLDALVRVEEESEGKINTILQLRLHPSILELRERVKKNQNQKKFEVNLTYITSRGKWYLHSWKGEEKKSGGLASNIGIHFFDMLYFVFGNVQINKVYQRDEIKAAGYLEFENARVNWFLSIDYNDVPKAEKEQGKRTFRSITIDGEGFEFSNGFTDLHTTSYQSILDGKGFSLSDTRTAVEIVSRIRNSKLTEKKIGVDYKKNLEIIPQTK